MFERFDRSYALVMSSWAVLRAYPGMMVFPLLSGLSFMLIIGSFLGPLIAGRYGYLPWFGTLEHLPEPVAMLISFCLYISCFLSTNFFNTALAEVANRRLDGEEVNWRDGIKRAREQLGAIFAWSVVQSTVVIILDWIGSRTGWIGRLITTVVGMFWAGITSLVVPVLALEEIGPIDAIQRSDELLRRVWGEALIAEVGTGFFFCLIEAAMAAFLIPALLFARSEGAFLLLVAAGLLVSVGLMLAHLSLKCIVNVALYRFACGESDCGIETDLAASAFLPRS